MENYPINIVEVLDIDDLSINDLENELSLIKVYILDFFYIMQYFKKIKKESKWSFWEMVKKIQRRLYFSFYIVYSLVIYFKIL